MPSTGSSRNYHPLRLPIAWQYRRPEPPGQAASDTNRVTACHCASTMAYDRMPGAEALAAADVTVPLAMDVDDLKALSADARITRDTWT